MAAIAGLREDLLEKGVKTTLEEPVQPAAPEVVPVAPPAPDLSENLELKQQLSDLSGAITETRRELASLRDPNIKSAVEVKSAT